jgi:hypothetical protein
MPAVEVLVVLYICLVLQFRQRHIQSQWVVEEQMVEMVVIHL